MNKEFIPQGVLTHKKETGILLQKFHGLSSALYISWSTDGVDFRPPTRPILIFNEYGKKEVLVHCSHFQCTETPEGWIFSYIRTEKNKRVVVFAEATDLYSWQIKGTLPLSGKSIALVSKNTKKNNFLLYTAGTFWSVMHSSNLKQWVRTPRLLMTSRSNSYDSAPLTIIGSLSTKKGTLIIYDASYKEDGVYTLLAGAVLFSKDDPTQVVWRSDGPLWKGLIKSDHTIFPLGVTKIGDTLTLYWATKEDGIITISISLPDIEEDANAISDNKYLERFHKNPIIEPHHHNEWENEAVFNPAAVYDGGKVHLLYRAIGRNGISVLGYAASNDGFSFKKRLNYPVYEPSEDHSLMSKEDSLKTYNPLLYTSGGGWSGCEDPRAVTIGKHMYVIYLAFSGWNSMRITLTSISTKKLHEHQWDWTEPVYLSPPGEVHKNWVLFPEKIKGKFAVLHSISPKICIHYFDSFKDFDGKSFIKSSAPTGGRKTHWDTKVRGAGPPPLKTKLGWLVLYHANDISEPHKYKLGAMILDKEDPQKVLYRTSHPILSPNMVYENNGKPGIVYASGAVIKDGQLLVYYGGADRVVCVASAWVDELLEKIKQDVEFQLQPLSTNLI